MSATTIFAGNRMPTRGHASVTRRLASTFNMIGLMLVGAWPETRMIRLRVPAGTEGAPDR
jgi:hypothetical protein